MPLHHCIPHAIKDCSLPDAVQAAPVSSLSCFILRKDLLHTEHIAGLSIMLHTSTSPDVHASASFPTLPPSSEDSTVITAADA